MKQKILSLLTLSLTLNACIGMGQSSSFLLKSPIQDQCNSTGLNACDSIIEGIILYIDGDTRTGQSKLLDGIYQNCDKIQELRSLTNSLETLSYIPYAKQYAAPITPIIKYINQYAEQCVPTEKAPQVPSPLPVENVVKPKLDNNQTVIKPTQTNEFISQEMNKYDDRNAILVEKLLMLNEIETYKIIPSTKNLIEIQVTGDQYGDIDCSISDVHFNEILVDKSSFDGCSLKFMSEHNQILFLTLKNKTTRTNYYTIDIHYSNIPKN